MPIERYNSQPVGVANYQPGGGGFDTKAIGDLIGVADSALQLRMQQLAHRATVQGRLAGAKDAIQRDAEGNLLPLSQLPAADTIYGEAYRDSAIANYGVAAQVDAQNMADKLAREHQLDPEAFRQSWNTYQQKSLSAVHEDVAPTLEPFYVRIGGDRFGKLADAQALRERKAAVDNVTNLVDAKIRETQGQAYQMGLSQGGVERVGQIVLSEIKPLLDQRLKIDPNYNTALEREDLRAIQSDMVGQGLLHEAWSIASGSSKGTGGVAEPDTDKAKKWLDSLIENPGHSNAGPLPSTEGMASLNLTPQEQHLYDHHVRNVTGGGQTDNADGSYSSIRSISVERDGRTYNIPTIWDGKIVSNKEAMKRAGADGWDKWPSYATEAEAEKRYNTMHEFMGKDRPTGDIGSASTLGDVMNPDELKKFVQQARAWVDMKSAESEQQRAQQREGIAIAAEKNIGDWGKRIDGANIDQLDQLAREAGAPTTRFAGSALMSERIRNQITEQLRSKISTVDALKATGAYDERIANADLPTTAKLYEGVASPDWHPTGDVQKDEILRNNILGAIRTKQQQLISAYNKDAPARQVLSFSQQTGGSLPQNATGERAAELWVEGAIQGGASFDPRTPDGEAGWTDLMRKGGVLPQSMKNAMSSIAGNPSAANMDFAIPLARAYVRAKETNGTVASNLSTADQQFYETLALQDQFNPGAPGLALKATLADMHRLRGLDTYQQRYDAAKAVTDDPTQARQIETDMLRKIAGPTSLVSQIYRDVTGQSPPPEMLALPPEDANRSIMDLMLWGQGDHSITGLPQMPPAMMNTYRQLFTSQFAQLGDRDKAIQQATIDVASQWGLSRTGEGGQLSWVPYPAERFTNTTHGAIMDEAAAVLDQNWDKAPSLSAAGKPDFQALKSAGKIWLEPDWRAFSRGKMGWEIHYRGEDGVPSSFIPTDQTFVPSGSTPLSPAQEARRLQAQKDVAGVPTVLGRQILGGAREFQLGTGAEMGRRSKQIQAWWELNNPLGSQ